MAISFSRTPEGDIISDHHLIAQVLTEALPYIDFLKNRTLVIKLGGSTIEYQREVLQDVIWLRALGAYPVIVHGGGPYITQWLTRLNIPTRFVNALEDGAKVELTLIFKPDFKAEGRHELAEAGPGRSALMIPRTARARLRLEGQPGAVAISRRAVSAAPAPASTAA